MGGCEKENEKINTRDMKGEMRALGQSTVVENPTSSHHHSSDDNEFQGIWLEPKHHVGSSALAKGKALSLSLLLDRPSAFETALLLFQFLALSVQLILHLAVSRI